MNASTDPRRCFAVRASSLHSSTSPFLHLALLHLLLILLPYLGRKLLDLPLVREASGDARGRRLRTPSTQRLAPYAELHHIGFPQVDMSGEALIRPGSPLDAREVPLIAFQWFVCIQRARVGLLAWALLRPFEIEALNHVDVVHGLTFGTVDLPLPDPEGVRVQVVHGVTGFPTHLLLAPDDITHGGPSFGSFQPSAIGDHPQPPPTPPPRPGEGTRG